MAGSKAEVNHLFSGLSRFRHARVRAIHPPLNHTL